MTLKSVLVHSQRLVKRRGAGGGEGMGTSGHLNISIGVKHQIIRGRPIWLDCGKTVTNIYLLQVSIFFHVVAFHVHYKAVV